MSRILASNRLIYQFNNPSIPNSIGNAARRQGDIDNLLSHSLRFGLKPFKARKIIEEVQQLTQQWQAYFSQHGVSTGEIERLKAIVAFPRCK